MVLKSYVQSTALLDVSVIRPLLVLRAEKRNIPSKNTKRDGCAVTVTRYCKLLSRIIEDTTKITAHDELNTSSVVISR